MTDREQLLAAIHSLGLEGKEVCIHSSMRSFHEPVQAGADGLLDAFLDAGCTVMAPTFSYMCEAAPTPEYMPAQNGAGDYSFFLNQARADVEIYDSRSAEMSVQYMGVFPRAILKRPGRVRGENRLNSFAAAGPCAEMLAGCQTDKDVYAPFARLYDDDGYVLLIGVELDCATAIHYAEQKAGRNPFVRWAKDAGGRTVPVCTGSCSVGFGQLEPYLAGFEKRVTVGGSVWRCYRIRDLVDGCVAAIRKNPRVTHCGNPECARCNDAVLGGPEYGNMFE